MREAETDRATAGDDNAMGPVAKAVRVPTAGYASEDCDYHDRDRMKVRIQRGAVAVGVGASAEEHDGPDGAW